MQRQPSKAPQASMQKSIYALTQQSIADAASVIKRGGLVAFPTETVYGLGADGFNPEAVRKIYEVKGRPGDNPLILHLESAEAVAGIVETVSSHAKKLMDKFWPGPLTLVFKKRKTLPAWVGGHPSRTADTVALRVPANPIAMALIKASGCAIAAPSANRAGRPSPTRADHVFSDYGNNGAIDYVLDGGETERGLESTVVDVSGSVVRMLRPGAVTKEMVEETLGMALGDADEQAGQAPLSPGMKYRHYAPEAPMTLVCGEPEKIAVYITGKVSKKRTGILATDETKDLYADYFRLDGAAQRVQSDDGEPSGIALITVGSRASLEAVAHNLYGCLRRFDELGVDEIYAEGFEERGLGQAIMNRLKKAAGGRIVWLN
jgi:L-threonylcarbamoyladenylate synthase